MMVPDGQKIAKEIEVEAFNSRKLDNSAVMDFNHVHLEPAESIYHIS